MEHSGDSLAFPVFARSEAVHEVHVVPLHAVFLHQGSGKGPRLCPTWRNVSGTWMHLHTNLLMAWAWLVWKWDALEHER